ncbi:MAG: peroxidase family protein [Hyphomicrobiaceae bacterium]
MSYGRERLIVLAIVAAATVHTVLIEPASAQQGRHWFFDDNAAYGQFAGRGQLDYRAPRYRRPRQPRLRKRRTTPPRGELAGYRQPARIRVEVRQPARVRIQVRQSLPRANGPYHGAESYGQISTPYVIDKNGKQCRGFGRLFPLATSGIQSALALPPYHTADEALRRLGRSMVEPRGQGAHPAGDSEMPAGYTFLAQFIDHDITLDTTSMLNMPVEVEEIENARTVDLDLDSVYGGGPERAPFLYRLPYLRVGRPVLGRGAYARFDLLRTYGSDRPGPEGGDARALIGDPRNDENFVIAQLHAAFIAFHNTIVDRLIERRHGRAIHGFCRASRYCGPREYAQHLSRKEQTELFEAARDHVIHYYHRVIIEDFLPRLIGVAKLRSIVTRGRSFFFPRGFRYRGKRAKPFIPVEFAVAAFRYGHSQVRNDYQLRRGVRRTLLDAAGSRGRGGGAPAFVPLSRDLVVDWQYFFPIDRYPVERFNFARRIDPAITQILHDLGRSNVVEPRGVVSLPARNLSRGLTYRLPSGQDVADRILPILYQRGELQPANGRRYGQGRNSRGHWQNFRLPPDRRTHAILRTAQTPLWYYVLQEAAVFGAPSNFGVSSYRVGLSHRNGKKRYAQLAANTDYGRRLKYGSPAPRRYDEARAFPVRPLHGHTLGPVGGTIVGEVLVGLLDHYREKTGKGLGYRPAIRANARPGPRAPLSLTPVGGYGDERARPRYLMRNLLIDARLVAPIGGQLRTRIEDYDYGQSRCDPASGQECADLEPRQINYRTKTRRSRSGWRRQVFSTR